MFSLYTDDGVYQQPIAYNTSSDRLQKYNERDVKTSQSWLHYAKTHLLDQWEADDEDMFEDDDFASYSVTDGYWTIDYHYDDDEEVCAADYRDLGGTFISFTVEDWEGDVAITPSHVGPSTDFVALREAARLVNENL